MAPTVDRSAPIVDAHHHLWNKTVNRYPWLEGPMHDRGWGDWTALRENYLVTDLLADARHQSLSKSVHVQANVDPSDPVAETAWLEEVASHPRARGLPTGIVGYVNFLWNDVDAWLDRHAAFPRVRGIRQVLNRHLDPVLNRADHDYLSNDTWRRNVGLLRRHGWSFDAQVYWHQMPALAALAAQHPDTTFVLDHAGMPAERDAASLDGWAREMRRLASCPNVVVKLSGYGMTDTAWTLESIRPYVLRPIEWFGPGRAMFGSNFPVDRLMADYDRLWDAYRTLVADLSADEQRALLSGTAERVYRI
jgi:predicted TIM-barrel fold metal-dependent hydrolase